MKPLSLLLVLIILVSSFGMVGAQDAPPVERVPVDFGIVGGYRYMRVSGSDVPVYSAPNAGGEILYRFEGGYDFVSLRNESDEWVEINPGEWVDKSQLYEVYASQFSGVLIQSEPAIPFGWVLVGHYASAEPGGAEVKEEAFSVPRYQLVNFYNSAVDGEGFVWYDIGGGRWVKQTLVSKVSRVSNPGVSGRWVAVDIYEQNLVAYEGNTMVFATVVSSGLPGNDTNTGIFEIYAKSQNAAMDGTSGGYGDYRLENVPYAMYFDNDISLHGTYWHNRFGYRQSRGCVNLTISDARWLYEWLGEGSHVYVYYSQSY
jgi:lipoprotein-anchoring transpeptidase ErfK/SrfK